MSVGTNDVGIMMAILFFCLACGFIAPFVTTSTETYTEFQSGDLTVQNPYVNSSLYTGGSNILLTGEPVGTATFVMSVGQALFWTFSWSPMWFTWIHIVVRVIGILLLIRLLRSGGG